MISTFVFAGLLAADGPLAAGQAAPAPEAPRLVCRRIPELGSRLRAQRVCKTKEEWATEREENRRMIDHTQTARGNNGVN